MQMCYHQNRLEKEDHIMSSGVELCTGEKIQLFKDYLSADILSNG